MRPSTFFWRAGVSAAAGGLLLMPWAGSLATDRADLQVLDVHWVANLIDVTVFHPGSGTVSGRLIVEVGVRGERTLAIVPFTMTGGRKATIRWVSSFPVEEIHRVGIIVDDGTPF